MSSSTISTDSAAQARDPATVIAFQGAPGAYSEAACVARYPAMATLPCKTFSDTFAAVADGRAGLAMIPIENSAAGRVADIHQLLPQSDLHIIAEHFERVRHNLLACPGAEPSGLETVHSHVHALSQCRKLIDRLGLLPVVHADTAGAAAEVAASGDPTRAAIASRLAAETYGLAIVEADIEDESHNTTRFVVLSREPLDPEPRRRSGDYLLHVRVPQRAGGALQVPRRFRHQRRQHDETRKLHGGRHLLGDGLLRRGGRAIRRMRRSGARWKSSTTSRGRSGSWASTSPIPTGAKRPPTGAERCALQAPRISGAEP